MAKVFSPPPSIPRPDVHPITTYDERCDEYRAAVREWIENRATKAGRKPHRLAGRSLYIPYADGAAEYIVLSGTELLYMPLGDAWNVPEYQTRGLRVADIERMSS